VLSIFAREAAGALGTRLSLRPLLFEDGSIMQTPGASRRGNAETRHCERSEAIHAAASKKDGLLRFRSQ
jgi:hypothetical protein